MEKQQEDDYPKHGVAPTDPETGFPELHWGTLRSNYLRELELL